MLYVTYSKTAKKINAKEAEARERAPGTLSVISLRMVPLVIWGE